MYLYTCVLASLAPFVKHYVFSKLTLKRQAYSSNNFFRLITYLIAEHNFPICFANDTWQYILPEPTTTQSFLPKQAMLGSWIVCCVHLECRSCIRGVSGVTSHMTIDEQLP